ncbi:MAG: hypothetical protein Unbinned2365contig1001_9 [Prokaryotic dsDNA virus sp.]|nr:MAG: hypothetical protein Unbinned2365contig1001_9 [Prokaryotic dsDNA virus sp.]|tara:strand:- start:4010 stop:4945 length:936 start_codon:yes stop_codon:yes gene_type:complete
MATTTSITSTYAGEFAGKYIAAALLSANTIDKGGLEVMPNIKFKSTMKKVATDANIIKDATCDFGATGEITLTERLLQPEEFQVNLELCKKDFRSDWEAAQMGISVYDNLPPKFSDFIIAHVAGLVAEKNEQNIWEGVNSNTGEYDGLVTLALADSDVIDVASHAAVTASNVIDKLGSIVDAVPSALYNKEDLHIYVSQNIARAYVRALGGFASGIGSNGTNAQGTQWYNAGGQLSFDGVKLFVCNGLADDTAMAAQKSNLYFGTGLLSDMNEVKVLDMADLDGSQNVRVVMRYTAGVNYGIGSDIVLYHA